MMEWRIVFFQEEDGRRGRRRVGGEGDWEKRKFRGGGNGFKGGGGALPPGRSVELWLQCRKTF